MNDDLLNLIRKTNQKILAEWAEECAKRVLHYFEEKYPDDKRPREAIDSLESWIKGKMKMTEVRKYAFKAHDAARDSEDDFARFAARAAGQAAGTAHVSGHAIHAAEYALKSVGAEKAENEKIWQYRYLLELIN